MEYKTRRGEITDLLAPTSHPPASQRVFRAGEKAGDGRGIDKTQMGIGCEQLQLNCTGEACGSRSCRSERAIDGINFCFGNN
jgi:hypothetical protein